MVFYIENALLGPVLGFKHLSHCHSNQGGMYICYGIFVRLLFSLYFICLNFASFLIAYLSASICFLNSTIHDKGQKI